MNTEAEYREQIFNLRKRAEIRRGIPRPEPDRISTQLEEAANSIEDLLQVVLRRDNE